MSKKLIIGVLLLAFCISLILPVGTSFAAADPGIRVTLPKFTVLLNGNKVDNQYREYPLLVYKDITYFPMTWYDSRLLGLETEWTPKEGLKISKGNVTSSYVPYQTKHKNSANNNATIYRKSFSLNGKIIDNTQEEYPLISFNNVTYFPLTWKFAHDEFGWDYQWNSMEGLKINANNPQVRTVSLPSFAGVNGVAVFEGYYYYVETAGGSKHIYRAAITNASKKELVYSYNVDVEEINRDTTFEIRDNELWFSYHSGGNIMGSDVYGKIHAEGKATIEHRGYLEFMKTPYGTLLVNMGVPPFGNNLYLIPDGQENIFGKEIGDPKLIYNWRMQLSGGAVSYRNINPFAARVGDDIYMIASTFPTQESDLDRIYRINLKTNETVKVINEDIIYFTVLLNKLYYVKNQDKQLYSSSLDGTNEQKLLSNIEAYWYGELDGNIFATVANTEGQLQLYKVEHDKEHALLLPDLLESVQIVNGKIICKLDADADYGIKVLDKSGNLLLAITDHASTIFAYKDSILMVSAKDKSIKMIQLGKGL